MLVDVECVCQCSSSRARRDNCHAGGLSVGCLGNLESAEIYQSPQCETVLCWNFIFQVSPCFTHTVLKC